MLKITMSTSTGETVTTVDAAEARNFIIEHADADPITAMMDAGRFHRLMLMNNWMAAANVAEELGLIFVVAKRRRSAAGGEVTRE